VTALDVGKLFLVACAALLVLTAIIHSALGERFLLTPLLRQTNGILASGLARFILRFAWHLTSLSWLVLAVTLLALQFQAAQAFSTALIATGIAFTAAGVFDAFGSRGRHIGWPLLTAIGILSLLAGISRQRIDASLCGSQIEGSWSPAAKRVRGLIPVGSARDVSTRNLKLDRPRPH
jgi:apolipoprotein N-acyltransferase